MFNTSVDLTKKQNSTIHQRNKSNMQHISCLHSIYLGTMLPWRYNINYHFGN